MNINTDGITDFIVTFKWLLLAGLAIIGLLAFVVYAQASYKEEHHCKETGQQRIAYYQQIGTLMYPIYEKENLCDGGEHRWF